MHIMFNRYYLNIFWTPSSSIKWIPVMVSHLLTGASMGLFCNVSIPSLCLPQIFFDRHRTTPTFSPVYWFLSLSIIVYPHIHLSIIILAI